MFTLVCQNCDQAFESRFRNQIYCSRECKYAVGRIWNTCNLCDKKFQSRANRPRQYCSLQCFYQDKLGETSLEPRRCPICLGVFMPKQNGTTYCSLKCSHIGAGLKRTGSNNPNWKDGINCYGSNWSIISSITLERDKFTCQKCSDTGCYLEAHHIIPAAFYRNHRLANRAINLITLCRRCHNGVKKNKKDSIPEMLMLRKAYQTQDW